MNHMVALAAGLMACAVLSGQEAAAPVARPEVVVWLLPAEPGVQPTSADTAPTDFEIDRINQELVPPGVVLDNTRDPRLREQLSAWNPEFAVPNLAWLRGQTATLKALGRFAQANNVTVRARFWTWASIFSALDGAITGQVLPDVSQVGSGWVAYLQRRAGTVPFDSSAPKNLRREYGNVAGVSLRYTTDVRLLYYWRKLPRDGSETFQLEHSTWQALVNSLLAHNEPPLAFPIGASLNVIHDLLPLLSADPTSLFHSGMTGPYVRFDSNSLTVPSLLSRRALSYDSRGLPRRLINFPEVTHEEAIQSFYLGGYVGIIEPVGFLRRWFDDFNKITSKDIGGSFWDYADVVAPPTGFKGGSDLVVFKTARQTQLAQRLAEFLATDDEYTKVLAQNGNLPVARGADAIPLLMGPMAATDEGRLWMARISGQIEQSIQTSREEPQLDSWPIDMESRDVLEAFQNVWRRIAEGDPQALALSIDRVESTINQRINPASRIWSSVLQFWQLASVLVVVAVALFALYKRQRAVDSESKRKTAEGARIVSEQARERSELARIASDEARKQSELAMVEAERAREASDRARKIQGFTAAALGVVDGIHRRKGPFSAEDSEPGVAEKSALVEVGLDGWLRGLDETNWQPKALHEVIWRSILLALDFQKVPRVFAQCLADEHGRSPERFLADAGLLRSGPEIVEAKPSFYFSVQCPAAMMVEQPFMLEQCLTCLLQNAIAASEGSTPDGKYPTFSPISVSVINASVVVHNHCAAQFSERLADVLNAESTVDEFISRIRSLLAGPPGDRPGLGTIISYLVSRECYGGLSVWAARSETSVRVRLRPAAQGANVLEAGCGY